MTLPNRNGAVMAKQCWCMRHTAGTAWRSRASFTHEVPESVLSTTVRSCRHLPATSEMLNGMRDCNARSKWAEVVASIAAGGTTTSRRSTCWPRRKCK
eukprot:11257265-Heterocapsa_arctica.AAC.1